MTEPPGYPPQTTAIATAPSATDPQDEASQNRELAGFWIDELTAYEKEFTSWTTRCKKIRKKYRDERPESNANNSPTARRYCILWSNVETIKPAIYARPPKAVAQRRWKTKDPVGKQAAIVLERSANFSIDCYHLDDVLKDCVQDYLLTARGIAWVRYEPTLTPQIGEDGKPVTDEQGNAVESLDYEKVVTDFVNWDDFSHSCSRTWPEVWWCARRTFQTRKQLITRFGKTIGEQVPLDWGPERNANTGRFEKRSKAAIYEIWSKRDNRVYFISRGWGERPLEVREPNYKLSDFFPCPRPCYGTTTTDSLVPVPDYIYYQDQAEEIDELTARIGKLTDSLKLVGIYAGAEQAMLQQLFSPNTDSVMIPVENWAMIADSKGISGLIDWFPVDQVIKVLTGCIELRKQLIEDIYQITGISDIVRGATDPNETATAQQIKGQWGGLRVRNRQQEIQRFARDIIQIQSEIIAQQFQVDTLKAMTGIELPMQAEKDAAQAEVDQAAAAAKQQAMLAQLQAARQGPVTNGAAAPAPMGAGGVQDGQPPDTNAPAPPQPPEIPPEVQKLLATPSWEDVMELLHNNELRDFKVDVETDSTIQPDEQQEKEQRTELLTSVSGFMKEMPLIPPRLLPVAGKLLLFAVRAFRAGPEMEDEIEQAIDDMTEEMKQPQPPQPDPLVIKAETEAKIREAGAAQELQQKGKFADADIQIKKALGATDIEVTRAKAAAEIETSKARAGADIENKGAQSAAGIEHKSAANAAAVEAKAAAAKPKGPKRILFERGPDGKISGATIDEGEAGEPAAAPEPNGAVMQ